HKPTPQTKHEVERALELVGAVGFTSDQSDLVLQVPEDARFKMECLRVRVAYDRPLFVVHPGCTMPARTYPWVLYAVVVEQLIERLGAMVALTGTAGERDLIERIRARLPAHANDVLAFAGELSFADLCALIHIADVTITNNTGPMHISAAVKTPVVALFALTNPPEQWGPWRVPHRQLYHDVPCRICYNRICPYGHECLRLVTPQSVVDAAAELVARSQQP